MTLIGFRERTKQRVVKYLQTVQLLMAGTTLGLVLVMVGPTLMELADKLNVSVAQMTYVAFGCDCGAFIGSALAIVIFKYISAQKVLIFFMLMIGVSNVLIPYGSTPLMTFVLTFASGCGIGVVEIGAYVWLVALWIDNAAPIIHLLHLTYGIGAAISPLIAEPYLSYHESLNDTSEAFNETFLLNETEILEEFTNTTLEGAAARGSLVHIPYAMIGSYALLNCALMVISYSIDRRDIKPEDNQVDADAKRKVSKVFQWTLVLLIGLYTLISVVLETTIARFFSSYAVHKYNMTRSQGAYITSTFYVGFTAVRIIGVPLSVKITPMQMMNLFQCLLFGSSMVLTVFDTDENILWICSFLLGAGLSPLFGSSTAWLSRQVNLSHDFMGVIMTLVCFGALAPPLFVGNYIEHHSEVLMYVTTMCALIMIIVSWIMSTTVAVNKRLYKKCPQNDLENKLDENFLMETS